MVVTLWIFFFAVTPSHILRFKVDQLGRKLLAILWLELKEPLSFTLDLDLEQIIIFVIQKFFLSLPLLANHGLEIYELSFIAKVSQNQILKSKNRWLDALGSCLLSSFFVFLLLHSVCNMVGNDFTVVRASLLLEKGSELTALRQRFRVALGHGFLLTVLLQLIWQNELIEEALDIWQQINVVGNDFLVHLLSNVAIKKSSILIGHLKHCTVKHIELFLWIFVELAHHSNTVTHWLGRYNHLGCFFALVRQDKTRLEELQAH